MCNVAVGELGNFGDLVLPRRGQSSLSAFSPMGLRQRVERDRRALHRPQQAHAALDLAVVEHQARRRHLHGGRPDCAVDEKRARGSAARSSASSSVQRLVALAAADREDLRLRAGLRMDIERAPVSDRQALGSQRLDAEIIGAGGDRAFDLARAAAPRTRRTACSAGRSSAPAGGSGRS